jgi:hypothetical protein
MAGIFKRGRKTGSREDGYTSGEGASQLASVGGGRGEAGDSGKVERRASVFEIKPFNLSMYHGEDLNAVFMRFSGFFSSPLDAPMRILAQSEPYSLDPAIRRIDTLLPQASQRWQRDGLEGYRHFLKELSDSSHLHGIRYFLQAWLGRERDMRAANVQGHAASHFMTEVTELEALPPFFKGAYRTRFNYLEPLKPGEPYLALLTSYGLLGEWDLRTIHTILQQPFPVGLAIDISTFAPTRASYHITSAINANKAHLDARMVVHDSKTEAALEDAMLADQLVKKGQRLHRVSVVVMVKGHTLSELDRNLAAVQISLADRLPLRRESGNQEEALRYFSDRPTSRIRFKPTQHTAVSDGVAALLPIGLRRSNDTEGTVLGIDIEGGYPVSLDIFTRQGADGGPSVAHKLSVGIPGYGKTFGDSLLLYRHALQGIRLAVLEPKGDSWSMVKLLGDACSYNRISMENTAINVLDWVEGNLTKQITHVRLLLQVLRAAGSGGASAIVSGTGSGAGAEGGDAGRLSLAGRYIFDNEEQAVIDDALRDLYAGVDPSTLTPAETPRLEQLCLRLGVKGQVGARLAREFAGIYVDGVYGEVFNPRGGTSLDLRLNSPCTAFDFSDVDETFRGLWYYLVLGAINKKVHFKPHRERMLVFVDEFGCMADEPLLARKLMQFMKMWRYKSVGIWLAEQDLSTFRSNETVRRIIQNTELFTLYRQNSTSIPLARELFEGKLTEYHSFLLQNSGRGECIAILGDNVHHMDVRASRTEFAALKGS